MDRVTTSVIVEPLVSALRDVVDVSDTVVVAVVVAGDGVLAEDEIVRDIAISILDRSGRFRGARRNKSIDIDRLPSLAGFAMSW